MNVLHLIAGQTLHLLNFIFGNLEHQLVVNLQRHSRSQSAFDHRSIDPDHRHLDQICGSALQGCVDGSSLGKSAEICVFAIDIRNGPNSPEQGSNFLFAAGLVESLVDEFTHAAVLLKVSVDESFRLRGLDPKILRQSKWRKPINNPEIYDFSLAPVVGADHEGGHSKYLRCSKGMDVIATTECLDQQRIIGEMSQ